MRGHRSISTDLLDLLGDEDTFSTEECVKKISTDISSDYCDP